ncbi:uncharacterized protein HD556DRAFT_1305486 [Suillus plorans]|uniref:Uncharacterized protein n=1 Tax=Suillus plorans TaxID=116603 RepID=A0A9P7DNF7_9AGAM|nr:uncharacterized protein HD556DRAFT_1305486 [Suillus plorans]KAG1799240.1 hypothetical protein HD556DRAFT_1305486 [Suillus plorans]
MSLVQELMPDHCTLEISSFLRQEQNLNWEFEHGMGSAFGKKAIIHEHYTEAQRSTRSVMLGDLTGGAAAIRFALEESTTPYRVAFCGGKRQMILTNVKVLSPCLVNFTWPDGLEIDRHALTKIKHTFDLGFELAAHKRDIMCLGQSHQLQAIINAVQKKHPPLRPEVQYALENLVKCQSSKSKKQTFQNEVPSSESLAVAYWGSDDVEEANENNTFITKNMKFVIPSSQDDDLHLVEETKARECKWKLLVDSAEGTGNGMLETGDSANRVNAKINGLEDGENRERGPDEGEVEECNNREDKEECIPTSLRNPAKPNSPAFLDLKDEEEKRSNINGPQILEDICLDAPPGALPTELPILSLHDAGIDDDLEPQATTSGSAMVKKTQKCGHNSLTSSDESHYERPGSSHHDKHRRKCRQLGDLGRSGSSTLRHFQDNDDLTSQLG